MAQITAALVRELRERTGSGMMDCKRALEEAGGDIEAAVEAMRKSGLAKADNRAGRIAAEGTIVIGVADDGKTVAMAEVNCETDFVSKGEDFQGFALAIAERIVKYNPEDLEALLALPLEEGKSIDHGRRELIARIGENINVRRFVRYTTRDGILGSYLHGKRIGVVVEMQGGDKQLAKDIAMHVAASKPICVSVGQVPAELLAKEREIYIAQAVDSGKRADIVEKMVEGRLRKYLTEITLLGQPFVKEPEHSVEQLLGPAKARVVAFQRFELGEGIAKKSENFAAEVMAQMREK
jgi:elongation factor Ts